MNPVIVIPSFIRAAHGSEDAGILQTFDHETVLGNKDDLSRCLSSLQKVQGVGQIIVLVASEENISLRAEKQVHLICRKFKNLHTAVFGRDEVELIQQRMEQLGLGTMYEEIGFGSYGAVRNLGLVLAHVLGFDSVVFIDDDEVVSDPKFLQKAMYGLGKITPSGVPILAKSGYFLNELGSYTSKRTDRWHNRKWPQRKLFNEWIRSAMAGKRLSRSNHASGGCMALSQEAYKRVAFDPYIARGEDLDYVLNLRMYGSDMWFDNQWHLNHRPPQVENESLRFRQNVYRWIYEYRKLEFSRTQIDLLQIKPSSLEPYPGPFLKPDIFKRLKTTARSRMMTCPDKIGFYRAMRVAANEADLYATTHCDRYFKLQFVWPDVMAQLQSDTVLRTALVQSVSQHSIEMGKQDGTAEETSNASVGENNNSQQEQKVQRNAAAQKGISAHQWEQATQAAKRAASASKVASEVIRAVQSGEMPSKEVNEQASRSFETNEHIVDPGVTSEIKLDIEDSI